MLLFEECKHSLIELGCQLMLDFKGFSKHGTLKSATQLRTLQVLTAEGTYDHWSLFNRFIMANDILDAADAAGKLKESCAAVSVPVTCRGNWMWNCCHALSKVLHILLCSPLL